MFKQYLLACLIHSTFANIFFLKKLFLFVSISSLLFSCNSDKPKLSIPEVEEKKISLKIERFEQDVFNTDPNNISGGIALLRKKYGSFFNDFAVNILSLASADTIEFNQTFLSFTQDRDMKDVNKLILKKYPDLADLESDLAGAFTYYKHYYPDSLIPRVVSMNSGFNFAVVTTDTFLAIGLEMYLGDSCQYYPLLGLPKYKTKTMTKEFLATDVIKGWASTVFEEPANSSSLLSKMIYQGKLLYFLDALYPETEDAIKINYSPEQMKWCEENQSKVWKMLVNKKLLFSTQKEEIVKLVNEAPFTAGLPRESPGRIGQWLGWQIIRAYMKNHPDVTLQQLMKENDFEKILRESKYKP